jgi:uncharacterized protein YerC
MKSIPSVNKFKSREAWEVYIWKRIVKGLSEAGSAQEIEKSLNMLLTVYEKKQIIKRASAVSLLKQGKSYSKIGELLWLSPQTISAIRKSLRAQSGYISNYTRNKKPEKKQKPLTKKEWGQLKFSLWIESLFTLPPPPIPHPKLMRQLGYRTKFSKR